MAIAGVVHQDVNRAKSRYRRGDPRLSGIPDIQFDG
jgi:hypothetical protein